jgi:hypothetical protein
MPYVACAPQGQGALGFKVFVTPFAAGFWAGDF